MYFFMCTLGVGGAKIRQGRLIFEFAKVFLEEGQILLQGLLELSFDYLAHRTAFEERGIFKVICQFCFELEQFVGCGQAGIVGHNVQQFHEPKPGGGHPEGHHGAFFGLVLLDRVFIEVLQAELDKGPVLFKELRDLQILPALIRLLIKIDGPDPVLIVLDIGSDIDDEIIGSHVAEQADETAFIEFDEFFGQADLIGQGVVDEVFDEEVTGDAGDMFFDEGIEMGKIGDAVGG